MNFGGTSVPAATPASAPMPIWVNFSLPKIVTFMPAVRPIDFALSAKCVGVATLPGLFSRSRAKHTPLAIVTPFRIAFLLPPRIMAVFNSKRSLSTVLYSLN